MECIYTPSGQLPVKEMSYSEFVALYVGMAKLVLVSYEDDGESNPQQTLAYSADPQSLGYNGFNGWYIQV